MLNIRQSTAGGPSESFREVSVKGNNLAWLEENLPGYQSGGKACLLLLGGKGIIDFRLRVAQSHARDDLTPSHWSHVALLGEPSQDLTEQVIYEISLHPVDGFGYPPVSNAVQTGRLAAYRSTQQYPNIAVVQLPVDHNDVMKHLKRFMGQRAVLDALEQMMLWLSYVWGVGRAGNPLLDGQGIPSATMVEYVVGAAGFELTPGLASRSSCPEAIWQSARWWQDYYGREGKPTLQGAWRATHYLSDEINQPETES